MFSVDAGPAPQSLPGEAAIIEMSSSAVPPDVEAFLNDRIESYEELEILLLLRHEVRDGWTAVQIGSRLNIFTTLAVEALAALHARHLIGAAADLSETRYVYVPADLPLDVTLRRLADVYATHPVAVIKLMSANAIKRMRTGALRAFADAFILKKDTDDG